ncbi:hypothetical protein GCM10028808_45790 [Spirosoma migulaei]
MNIIISHPTGNSNARAACQGLLEADILAEFHTTLASFPKNFLGRISDLRYFQEIKRRQFSPLLEPYTHMHPWREVGRLIASRGKFSRLIEHEVGPFSIDAVYQSCDRHVASSLYKNKGIEKKAVYAYEDGAAFSFKEAKRLGIICLYDLPIGYWRSARRLLQIEYDRWPDWIATMPTFKDSDVKLARKDEELRLADRIFVASNFTAKTLEEFPGKLAPIEVIPYGFPPVYNERLYTTSTYKRRIKLLFVGSLSQRKGIADLLKAVEAFKDHIDLTIVGRKATEDCVPLNLALKKHHWIPSLPHEKVLQLMKENDVLIFPSLFEGFGLVITEAMAQGTPVITTDRTAGPDLIKHEENGWLIKASSIESIQSTIDQLLTNQNLIAETGHAALETARLRPWSVYSKELAETIRLAI